MTDVARFEVIDQDGRRLVLNHVSDVRLDYQDDGRTLKVFLHDDAKSPPAVVAMEDPPTDHGWLKFGKPRGEKGWEAR